RLDRAMIATAWGGARDADIVLVVIDAERGIGPDSAAILEGLAAAPRRAVLALNKIDRIRPEALLELARQANEAATFERTFMISALNGSGCDDLLDHLAASLPE